MTQVASTSVIQYAAVIALTISFLGKFTALISTIPTAALGGMSILLYGTIASNGLKILIEAKTDFKDVQNLIIASAILVLGLEFSNILTISGTALSAIAGILLNLLLPETAND